MADELKLTPEPVKELPKSRGGRKSENPAIPAVKAAHSKGPQRLRVGKANVSKVRGQLNRAGQELKLKVTTRAPDGEPDFVYFQVTDK